MRRRALMHGMLWLLLVLIGAAVLVYLMQDRMIYFPRRYAVSELGAARNGLVPLTFRTGEGSQTAFYLPPEGPEVSLPLRIWVILGGNATLALEWQDFARRFPGRAGFLLIDYPGYGACEGAPSPASILASTRGALDALARHASVDSAEIFGRVSFLGHSLGAAAALQAGAVIPARQVVLIAPFTSLLAMGKRSVGVPLAYLLRHNFDNEARLEEILRSKRPPDITIIHGDRDEVIPVEMGRALAASRPGALRYYEIAGGSHNSVIALQESLLYAEMTRIDIQDPNP